MKKTLPDRPVRMTARLCASLGLILLLTLGGLAGIDAHDRPSVVECVGIHWTARKTIDGCENAYRHYLKHRDNVGASGFHDYYRAARAFMQTPPTGTQTRVDADGDIVRFHVELDRFGVMRRDGALRTFFRPDTAIHGAPSDQAYFERGKNLIDKQHVPPYAKETGYDDRNL